MIRNELSRITAEVDQVKGRRRKRQRSKNEFTKYGRGKPRRTECRRYSSRNVQGDVEENTGDQAFSTYRSVSEL